MRHLADVQDELEHITLNIAELKAQLRALRDEQRALKLERQRVRLIAELRGERTEARHETT